MNLDTNKSLKKTLVGQIGKLEKNASIYQSSSSSSDSDLDPNLKEINELIKNDPLGFMNFLNLDNENKVEVI